MDEVTARTIPTAIAVCPICGAAVWIEDIPEASETDDGGLMPEAVQLTCTTEPDIDDAAWWAWHHRHFVTPYVDWLPLQNRVELWLQRPEQRERFEAIWNAGHAMLPS